MSKDVSLASPSSVYLLSHAVFDFTFQFKAFSVSIGNVSFDLFSKAISNFQAYKGIIF